jgi:hypothetical protein
MLTLVSNERVNSKSFLTIKTPRFVSPRTESLLLLKELTNLLILKK